MCFVFIWEKTATCDTYRINWLVFITEIKSVYSAVRTGSLNKGVCASSLKGKNLRRIKGALHADQYMYICDNISLTSSQNEKCSRQQLYSKSKHTIYVPQRVFRKSCRLWKNVGKYDTGGQATDDNIVRRMRFTCRMTKATNTHSEYITPVAFSRQQWLRERASLLRYTNKACVVSRIMYL